MKWWYKIFLWIFFIILYVSKLSPLAKSGHKCYKNMSKKSTDPTFNIGKYILREKWQAVKIPQALELKSSIRD